MAAFDANMRTDLNRTCHGEVEIWLVALQGVVERELADAQNFQIQILDALHPALAGLGRILEKPEVQNFPDEEFELFPGVSSMDADEDTKAAAWNVPEALNGDQRHN